MRARAFLICLAVLALLVAAAKAQTDYTTKCVCKHPSVNTMYCEQWTCSNTVDTASCFAGEAQLAVQTPSGGVEQKSMSELRLGDRVQALEASGELVWSPVIAWLHRDPQRLQPFLELSWEASEEQAEDQTDSRVERGSLLVTREHLVFVAASAGGSRAQAFDWSSTRLAADLALGQELVVVAGEDRRVLRARITGLREVLRRGVWAPLTRSGSLVVSGTVASAYASLNNQGLAHASFAPLRWWHRIASAVASPSSSPSEAVPGVDRAEGPSGSEDKVHGYARFLVVVARWLSVPLEGFTAPVAKQPLLDAPTAPSIEASNPAGVPLLTSRSV